jgi:TolB-like protein
MVAWGQPILGTTSPAAEIRLAVLPLKRGVRHRETLDTVDRALRFQLSHYGTVIGDVTSRQALRKMRLRDPDSAPPQVLRQLANELDVEWLVVATVHDAPGYRVPDLAVSARLYHGQSGQLYWAEFTARSGLDNQTVLGLGNIDSIDLLAPILVRRLLANLPLASTGGSRPEENSAPGSARLGRLAVIPMTAYVDQDAVAVADTGTEAIRAVLHRAGFSLADPGCVAQTLRRNQAAAWGEVPEQVRLELSDTCGADHLVTGSIESWIVGGSGTEPDPSVAVALRLLDASTGQILWMGSKEAHGWDSGTLFGLGRVHSRGALLDRLLSRLARELVRNPSLDRVPQRETLG